LILKQNIFQKMMKKRKNKIIKINYDKEKKHKK